MAKMGRPKQKITKKKSIGVRLSDQEYEILMQYATSHKLSITKVVQCALCLLYTSPSPRDCS